MDRTRLLTWAAALLVVPLLGCGAGNPLQPDPVDPIRERQLAPAVAADAMPLVEANNRFAFELYARLKDQGGNLFVSPFSISTAFGMTYAGAAGRTAEEMASVFHFPLPQERLHPTFGALVRSLDRGIALGGYELRVANRTWGQQGFPFRDEFVRITRDDYGAEMQQADFEGDPETARTNVNAWVAERTHDRIRDLFPQGTIDTYTRLVLANAIYFKGLWATQFDRAKTQDAPFYLSATEYALVPTMKREDKARLAPLSGATMLELPYRGGDLSMLVVLPHRFDGLPELEAWLTPEALRDAIAALEETPGAIPIALPRFRIESKFMLGRTLSDMGMPAAFQAGAADFSGIDGRQDLHISAAIHQSFVEVNEEGTEAAAATGISVGATSLPPVSFVANHPFLFVIHDNVTGSILFMGRLADPRG
jgi:serine protease inhibitor